MTKISYAGTVKLPSLDDLMPMRGYETASRSSLSPTSLPNRDNRLCGRLYFRFPLSLRMVEEMLAARGVEVSRETVRHWAEKFGREFSNRIRRRAPVRGDKWHLDEGAPRRLLQ